MTGEKLKILALHGYRTSAEIFKLQVAMGLGTELEDLVDIVYLDSPNPAMGRPHDDVPEDMFPGPYYEWYAIEKNSKGVHGYEGAESAIRYVGDFLRLQGPFDGIMGFSQGASVAALILAMQQQGALSMAIPPIRFGLFFGGVPYMDPSRDHHFRSKIRKTSIHIIGEEDYVKEKSYKLLSQFHDPLLIVHPQGHVVPRLDKESVKKMREFLEHQVSLKY